MGLLVGGKFRDGRGGVAGGNFAGCVCGGSCPRDRRTAVGLARLWIAAEPLSSDVVRRNMPAVNVLAWGISKYVFATPAGTRIEEYHQLLSYMPIL